MWRKALVGAVVAAILVIGGWWLLKPPMSSPQPIPATRTSPEPSREAKQRAADSTAASPFTGGVAVLPPPGVALATALPDLKMQASSGSAAAACRLAFELSRCASLGFLQQGARAAIDRAEADGLVGETLRRRVTESEKAQERFLQTQAMCRDVPQSEVGDAWKYLLQAARAGHGPSMARYVTLSGYLRPQDPLRVLDGWIAFRDEAPEYLRKAIELGYRDAYVVGSMGYATGEYFGLRLEKDGAMAVALTIASLATSPRGAQAVSEEYISNLAKRNNIPEADVARGRAMAPKYESLARARMKPALSENQYSDVADCE